MYEAVHVESATRTTPSRFAARARTCEYDGLVLVGEVPEAHREEIATAFDLDVATGVVIEATNRDEAGRAIRSAREGADVLVARSDEVDLQRFLVRRERLDVLVTDRAVAHTTAKVARDHGIAICVDLRPLIHAHGSDRVAAIRRLRRNLRICAHYDVPYVVTAGATSHFELRAPRELQSLGPVCGASEDRIAQGLEQWEAIVARTQRNRDDTFIEPGIEVVNDETNAG